MLAFDKQAHPRYKVCGGGLSARIAKILPEDFSCIVEKTVYRVQFDCGAREPFFIESSDPIAYMVMRSEFDQWLVEKARRAGTTIHEGEKVIKIQNSESGVEVCTAQGCYQSHIIIGADGVMSKVAQQCFPSRSLQKIPALESEVVTAKTHPFQQTPTALISLPAAKKGYGWIFPKRQGLSLGVGEFVEGTKRPKQSFHDFTKEEPRLVGLTIPKPLGHPIPITSVQVYGNGQGWAGRLVCGRAMLIGDAGHLVDPLLGEGIYYAIRSAQLAAQTVASKIEHPAVNRLDAYETLVTREFGPEFRVAGRLGKIVYGVPRSLHHWAGQQFPHAYQRVLNRYCYVLQGRETYQGLWARILQRLYWPLSKRHRVTYQK